MAPPSSPGYEEFASGPIDAVDEALLARTARVFEAVDPMPSGLVDRITFGITLDALHAEIAQLEREGARADVLAGIRGDPAAESRRYTFTADSLTLLVTVTVTDAARARVDGWVAPTGEPESADAARGGDVARAGAGVRVEIRTRARTQTALADSDGRFAVSDVARGLVQFVLVPPAEGAAKVITPSIEI